MDAAMEGTVPLFGETQAPHAERPLGSCPDARRIAAIGTRRATLGPCPASQNA